MIGSFLTSGLVMIFGYAYPAYECYKTVEKNKPEVEQLRFWCQYWILVAVLAVCERITDIFIFWIPMYSEAKLAFYIYLWYPKAKGAAYVYDSFVRPYIAKHETEIDRNLMEFRTRAGDMIVMYSQKAATYGQKRVFEILQFVASQPFPRPYQNQVSQKPEPKAAHRPTVASNRQATATAQQRVEEEPSPISSTSSSQQEEELEQEVVSSPAPKVAVTAKSIQQKLKKTVQHSNKTKTSTLKKTTPESSESTDDSANEADLEQTEQDKASSPPQDTVMEDAIRETRGRLRKTRVVVKKDA